MKYFRYAVVLTFVVAAVLTPPDVMSPKFMALPMLLLSGVVTLLAKRIEKRREQRQIALRVDD